MIRKINLEMTVDWDYYDDVPDDLVLEDAFEHCTMKDGVEIKIDPAKAEMLEALKIIDGGIMKLYDDEWYWKKRIKDIIARNESTGQKEEE